MTINEQITLPGFGLRTSSGLHIRFRLYEAAAPATCAAFLQLLPFTRTFMHARVSGMEIWTDEAPPLDVIQENASVFTVPGEMVYGPSKPTRAKTVNCMGIYYGDGKGLDCCNIFAKVLDEDRHLLEQLGQAIWKNGQQEITFTANH